MATHWTRPLGIAQRPVERLHAAEAAADHCRQPLDAERRDQARLGVDPVLDRHHREVAAVGAAVRGRVGVRMGRPGRAEARARVVDADDEEAIGVERLARADQVVPPALALLLAGVGAGDMVRGVERVADEDRVALRRVQRSVGLVGERVVAQHRAAGEAERLGEVHRLRLDVAERGHADRTRTKENPAPPKRKPGLGSPSLAEFIERPQAGQIGASRTSIARRPPANASRRPPCRPAPRRLQPCRSACAAA
jgi:hypothetical protein